MNRSITRRNFVKNVSVAFVGAAIVGDVVAKTTELTPTEELEKELQGLIARFDRKSPEQKMRMIENLEAIPTNRKKWELEADCADTVCEIFEELANYLKRRMKGGLR